MLGYKSLNWQLSELWITLNVWYCQSQRRNKCTNNIGKEFHRCQFVISECERGVNMESFWIGLNDDVLYRILIFVAPQTETALFICQKMCLVCKSLCENMRINRHAMWDNILNVEYGQTRSYGDNNHNSSRRKSKRLCARRLSSNSALQAIREAHWLICHRTRLAHFRLTEMAHSKQKEKSLNMHRLRGLFHEFGPTLRCNHPVDIGGTFLVEICRARYVSERIIYRCVKYLIEEQGSLPNISSVSEGSFRIGLTPLCIAAARGMPSVVRFLLQAGADPKVRSSGRFRLFCNSSKTITGVSLLPLDFSTQMKHAEIKEGAEASTVRSLTVCIKILTNH